MKITEVTEKLIEEDQLEPQTLKLDYVLTSLPCDRCERPAPRFSIAYRKALDLNLEKAANLQVRVSIHHCATCRHYFRAQPPYLKPYTTYTNRVQDKAISSVNEDGMAIRKVPGRLARDFWVKPHEKMVRLWWQAYRDSLDFQADYQEWAINHFSGILGLDEVYQGKLTLLLAVDPVGRGVNGDLLIGFEVLNGAVNSSLVQSFLEKLAKAGLQPQQVISDGSSLYPGVIKRVWPEAAHQLCLFHETRLVVKAAKDTLTDLAKQIPKAPKAPGAVRHYRSKPTSGDPQDPALQNWQLEQVGLKQNQAQAQALRQLGYSLRAISQQLGIDRRRLKQWLAEKVEIELVAQTLKGLESEAEKMVRLTASQPGQATLNELKVLQTVALQGKKGHRYSATIGQLHELHALARQKLSLRALSQQTGLHRRTISNWLAISEAELKEIETALSGLSKTEIAQLKIGQAQRLMLLRQLKPKQPTLHAQKTVKIRQVKKLAEQDLSYSAIARLTSIHRVTISKWLQEEELTLTPEEVPEKVGNIASPPISAPASITTVLQEAIIKPPAPWQDWQQVRTVRTLYEKYNRLVLRRKPLSQLENERLQTLLQSPLGEPIRVVADFIKEWYSFWWEQDGRRSSFDQAQSRYQQWHKRQDYQSYRWLRRQVRLISPERFLKLTQFLKQPNWEATNNGAERMGRAFRHRQAPHFNLRQPENLAGSLIVMALQKKRESENQRPTLGASVSSRGRKVAQASPLKQVA